jgi:AcrR family transcriptional regulator
MTDKTDIILAAATKMFARYGFAKTTINDIVAEAGVARQTLYNTFSSKEEILRGVVKQSGDAIYAKVLDAWNDLDDLNDKLAAYHELFVIALYQTIQSSPDWNALVEGMYAAALDEMADQDVLWRSTLLDLFRDTKPPNTEPQVEYDEIVDFFHSGSLNAKYGATDVAHLKRRLHLILVATSKLLES